MSKQEHFFFICGVALSCILLHIPHSKFSAVQWFGEWLLAASVLPKCTAACHDLPSTPAPEWSGVASKTELTHLNLVKHKLTAWQLSSAPHCRLTEKNFHSGKQLIESSLSESYGHMCTDFYHALKYYRCRHRHILLNKWGISTYRAVCPLHSARTVRRTIFKPGRCIVSRRCALSPGFWHTRRSILVKFTQISLCAERFFFCTRMAHLRFCDARFGVITFVTDFGPTGVSFKRMLH